MKEVKKVNQTELMPHGPISTVSSKSSSPVLSSLLARIGRGSAVSLSYGTQEQVEHWYLYKFTKSRIIQAVHSKLSLTSLSSIDNLELLPRRKIEQDIFGSSWNG